MAGEYGDKEINLDEQASPAASVAGKGKIWIENTSPTKLKFTNDDGSTSDIGGINEGTEQSPTGNDADFLLIPSNVKKIIVTFEALSNTSGTLLLIQLGDSGGVETSGYTSRAWNTDNTVTTSTAGFILNDSSNASWAFSGLYILTRSDSVNNTWVGIGSLSAGSSSVSICQGYKSLSAELDRIRITSTSGSDAFDAGSINIQYE